MWLPEALLRYFPAADALAMTVRPLFSGSDPGILTVQLASGSSISIGAISGSFSAAHPGSADVQSVPSSVTTVVIASGNLARMAATVFNDSSGTLYLRMGASASVSVFSVKLSPQDFYEIQNPAYTGLITGFWSSAGGGSAMVTEFTA